MGHPDGVFGGNPAHPVGSTLIAVALGVAPEAHKASLVRVGDFPGPAALEPFVGDLYLPAVADQLVKNAKLVTNAIAGGWNLE